VDPAPAKAGDLAKARASYTPFAESDGMLFVSSPFATKVEFEGWRAIDDPAERDAAVAIAWKDLLARQKRAAVPPWRRAALALAAKVGDGTTQLAGKVGDGTKQLAADATALASEWAEVVAVVKQVQQVQPPVIRSLKELSEGQRDDSLPAIAPLPKVTRELTIKEKRQLSGDFPLSNLTAPSPFQPIIDGTRKMADGTKEGLIKLGGGTTATWPSGWATAQRTSL